jgi:signal transduction histidine kinase
VTPKHRSLQARLAWRVGAVLVASILIVSGVLGHYVWRTIDDLDDASLQIQAQQIAVHVGTADGTPVLDLPENVRNEYAASGDGYMYALIDDAGRVMAASSDKARAFMAVLPPELLRSAPAFFRLPDDSGRDTPYIAYLTELESAPGVLLAVAQGHLHQDVFVDTVLTEFIEHIGWWVILTMAGTLAISISTIRECLKPLAVVSARAARITPASADIRLPVAGVPSEIVPLVEAVNAALDRLEQGFDAQRRFTANAAHELRTPLAVLTARLDGLQDKAAATVLGLDVARMTRLVDQLLRVARLEARPAPDLRHVELNAVAADVVAFMAPLAVAGGKSLALERNREEANADPNDLADAIRNLVENALQHAPGNGEVVVAVASGGTITVRDDGPGISEGERERIFERFWRAGAPGSGGAGLGLSIVQEIVRAHGGSVEVDTVDGGGTIFSIRIPATAGGEGEA